MVVKTRIVAALLLLSTPMIGQKHLCKGNPEVVSACYVVHGRATYGNGTPALRIWPVGTSRMLGITGRRVADDADDPIVPKNMMSFSAGDALWGDFVV